MKYEDIFLKGLYISIRVICTKLKMKAELFTDAAEIRKLFRNMELEIGRKIVEVR